MTPQEAILALRGNMSHVARGCKASTSHDPAPYVNEHETAVKVLESELARLSAPVPTPETIAWAGPYCPHGTNTIYHRCSKCFEEAVANANQRRTEEFMERIQASLERHAEILERLSR